MIKGRDRSDTSPIRRSPTLVPDRIQYAPNYDAKYQTGEEVARMKVGKKMTTGSKR